MHAGGCVYKGFNRAFATASAGVIALGVHWIASKSDDKFQPFIRSGSVFVLGTYQSRMCKLQSALSGKERKRASTYEYEL